MYIYMCPVNESSNCNNYMEHILTEDPPFHSSQSCVGKITANMCCLAFHEAVCTSMALGQEASVLCIICFHGN